MPKSKKKWKKCSKKFFKKKQIIWNDIWLIIRIKTEKKIRKNTIKKYNKKNKILLFIYL